MYKSTALLVFSALIAALILPSVAAAQFGIFNELRETLQETRDAIQGTQQDIEQTTQEAEGLAEDIGSLGGGNQPVNVPQDPAAAAQTVDVSGSELTGTWEVSLQAPGRAGWPEVLSLRQEVDGTLTGAFIVESLRSEQYIANGRVVGNQFSFDRPQNSGRFEGTITDDEIQGTMTAPQGLSTVTYAFSGSRTSMDVISFAPPAAAEPAQVEAAVATATTPEAPAGGVGAVTAAGALQLETTLEEIATEMERHRAECQARRNEGPPYPPNIGGLVPRCVGYCERRHVDSLMQANMTDEGKLNSMNLRLNQCVEIHARVFEQANNSQGVVTPAATNAAPASTSSQVSPQLIQLYNETGAEMDRLAAECQSRVSDASGNEEAVRLVACARLCSSDGLNHNAQVNGYSQEMASHRLRVCEEAHTAAS